MSEPRTTSPLSNPERARRVLDDLHDRELNFDPSERETFTPERGWHIDHYHQPLPREQPGEPLEHATWWICRQLMADYEFADPRLVRAVYHSPLPLRDRDMLLEGRFLGLRFLLGLRVGGVIDDSTEIGGRTVRRWGWNYRTLDGHLEKGQMDYTVRKWVDDGTVEFCIDAYSRPAHIDNPVVRFGFAVFGRTMQKLFARRALARMDHLVRDELIAVATGVACEPSDRTLQTVTVRCADDVPHARGRLRGAG